MGTSRRNACKEYSRLTWHYKTKKARLKQEQTKVAVKAFEAVQKQLLSTPCYTPADPNYKSLQFNRYADDFVIGIIGPREDTERVKADIRDFLANTLKLTLSEKDQNHPFQ